MGLCLEPVRFVTGLARVPAGIDSAAATVAFEQYERHTAWDRPGGVNQPFGSWRLGRDHLLRSEVVSPRPCW